MATQDNEDLTRIGPGTVMGGLMREYWMPAAKSSEVTPDGPPLRLMLLGEKLIAFRDSTGRVGVIDHRCPHRCVSLFLGRNEENGLRCVYHGWKFDVEGNCVDIPGLEVDDRAKLKVKAKAYRTAERNGVIWVYMGNREVPPKLPMLEVCTLPDADIGVIFMQRNSNWLQNFEGEIDTAHFNFLHVGSVDLENIPDGHALQHTVGKKHKFVVSETDLGVSYAAHTHVDESHTYWRFAHFAFPFWSFIPQADIRYNVLARGWVPMDDEHSMLVFFYWRSGRRGQLTDPLKDGTSLFGGSLFQNQFQPNTTDWFGRWRLTGNRENDWEIDRDAQKKGLNFSGINGIHLQDQAVTESMGPIIDRNREFLMESDLMVARSRRRLLKAARALKEDGVVPPGSDNAEAYFMPRGGYCITSKSDDWRKVYEAQLKRVFRPGEASQLTV